jgi:hypothetical protein
MYPALYGLRHYFGESILREEVERCLSQRGTLRVASTIQEEEPSCREPETVDIIIPPHLGRK